MKRQKEGKYRKEKQDKVSHITGGRRGRQVGSAQNRFLEMTVQFYEQGASNNVIKKHYKQKLLNYEEKIPKQPEKHALFTGATETARRVHATQGWVGSHSQPRRHGESDEPPAVCGCRTGQEQDVAALRCWTAGRAALDRRQATAGGVATAWVGGARAEPGLAEPDRGRGGNPATLCAGHREARARGGNGT